MTFSLRYIDTQSLKPHFLPLLVLLALTAATYCNLLTHSFLDCWDDPEYITRNPAVQGLSWSHLQYAFTHTFVGNYAPVHIASYMLDYSLWGMSPAGFLLANICYHFLSGALLYTLLVRLGFGRWGSVLGSAVFLVHPVQVESVAWLSQRKNLLAMLFYLLGFHAYLSYRSHEGVMARKWYLSSLAFYLLSLLSKAVAVVFPLMLILFDLLVPPCRKRVCDQRDKLPYLLAAGAVGMLTVMIQSPEIEGGRAQYPYNALVVLPLTMLTTMAEYIRLLFWPDPSTLCILYPLPDRTSLDSCVVVAICVLAALLLLGFYLFRRARPAFFWYCLFFLGLLPVSGIVPLVTKMNDRYLYFPMVGIAGLIAYACRAFGKRVTSRPLRRIATTGSLGIVATLAVACHVRGLAWQNTFTLFGDAVKKAPESCRSWFGLGIGYETAGDFERAAQLYEKGSLYGTLSMETSFRMAQYYREKGEYDKANRHYLFLRMQTLGPGGKPAGLLLLGEYQGMLGNYPEAEQYLLKYLALFPDAVQGLQALGKMYFMAGDYGKAGEYCDRALEAGGDSPELYFYGASLSALAGDRDRSRELLEKALQQGFSDRAAILGSKELAPIRNDPRFRQLLDRYLR